MKNRKIMEEKMKKILLTLIGAVSLMTVSVQGKEIIPENYLMERLIMEMEVTPTYISADGENKLKAIQVDSRVMKKLATNENPFYVYDGDGKEQLVRRGDYFVAPTRLSSIFVIEKDKFESQFRDEAVPEKSIKTKVEAVEAEILKPEDVDSGTMDIKETER